MAVTRWYKGIVNLDLVWLLLADAEGRGAGVKGNFQPAVTFGGVSVCGRNG